MTNSVKRSPYASYCGYSNADWKRFANRELRRTNKQLLLQGKELRTLREEANLYNSPLDGSVHYCGRADYAKLRRPRGIRISIKPPEWYEKALRK